MARAKICYLHIGAEKTGSTSIQAFLRANRHRLTGHGYLFPRTPGEDNQPALAAYAMKDSSRRNLMAQVGVRSDAALGRFQKEFSADLLAEVAKTAPERIVLTNEHCHSRIETVEELERLATLLHSVADEVRVIFYIRRQDKAATSLYSTALKVGQWRKKPNLAIKGELPISFDYWRTCELYASVFGMQAMRVRLFDRDQLVGGDLIADFCDALEMPAGQDWIVPDSKNQSLGRLGQRFLAAFNQKRQDRFGEQSEHYRMALVRMLDKHFSGKGIKPSQAAAKAFLSHFKAGNEKVRATYFPDMPFPLFGDDFSMYPEKDDTWMPGVFMAFDAGARLFVEQQKEIDRLKAEVAALKADDES
ncbi:hypothetical protein [Kordiimonas lacus]|uniref:Sulfotransferase family protein n=1 Tax=Kordiimonas lacus TaxID=637679 RepID=A0A1G6T444_9PROT|nr:hypothetical protein [Kordiimonas lacus]SDD23733.1 hypothetical protein SAMN04488071_0104 [Kordiimonas lacus]